MKLDELLDLAQDALDGHVRERTLARGIIELLGEAQPCGTEPPKVWTDGDPPNHYLRIDELISLGDARAYAAMLIRAAENAENAKGQAS